jgi:hypothetical protein
MDLAGLEDDTEFWNMDIDDSEDEKVTIKDLTNPQSKPNHSPLHTKY